MVRAMRIGIIGGTGKEGRGLAVRWKRAGHEVRIGSRDPERGAAKASELGVDGGGNPEACDADVVVLAVPYSAHAPTLSALKPHLAGKVLIDITVPLKPPKVREVHLPEGTAAALEAQALLGDATQVVGALHHVSSVKLGDPDADIDCDVLVCGDDAAAKETVIGLVEQLGVRAFDVGPLRNAVALESLTPILLAINKRYGAKGAALRITGVAGPAHTGN